MSVLPRSAVLYSKILRQKTVMLQVLSSTDFRRKKSRRWLWNMVEGQEGEAFILRNIENMISDPQ